MADVPELKELMSKTVAASSPLALQNTSGLLKGIMPILQQAFADVQKMQPPQPMDPSAASLQAAQLAAQTKQAEIQADTQSKQSQTVSDEKIKQAQIQADAAQAQQQMQNDLQIENLKANTILQKNAADNQTALQIASLRIETGTSGAGGLKDGTSLGTSYSEGGLVVERKSYADGGQVQPINIGLSSDSLSPILESLEKLHNKPEPAPLDLSPIVQAIAANKSEPTDLSPIVQAINAAKTPPTDLSPVIHAITMSKSEPVQPTDMTPLHEALQKHKDDIGNTLSTIIDGINETGKRLTESHQDLLDNLSNSKSAKKVKFITSRDEKGNLVGNIIEDAGENS